jgi:hypothetical protein
MNIESAVGLVLLAFLTLIVWDNARATRAVLRDLETWEDRRFVLRAMKTDVGREALRAAGFRSLSETNEPPLWLFEADASPIARSVSRELQRAGYGAEPPKHLTKR